MTTFPTDEGLTRLMANSELGSNATRYVLLKNYFFLSLGTVVPASFYMFCSIR